MLLILCILITFLFLNTIKHNNLKIEYISVTQPHYYKDLEELTKYSDFIAHIKILKLVETEQSNPPISIFKAKVIEPFRGCRKGDIIQFKMIGGNLGNHRIEVKDDQLPHKGDQYVVFIEENDDKTLSILGGPQGRFILKKNKLNSLKYVATNSSDSHGIHIKDIELKTFTSDIKSILANNKNKLPMYINYAFPYETLEAYIDDIDLLAEIEVEEWLGETLYTELTFYKGKVLHIYKNKSGKNVKKINFYKSGNSKYYVDNNPVFQVGDKYLLGLANVNDLLKGQHLPKETIKTFKNQFYILGECFSFMKIHEGNKKTYFSSVSIAPKLTLPENKGYSISYIGKGSIIDAKVLREILTDMCESTD